MAEYSVLISVPDDTMDNEMAALLRISVGKLANDLEAGEVTLPDVDEYIDLEILDPQHVSVRFTRSE